MFECRLCHHHEVLFFAPYENATRTCSYIEYYRVQLHPHQQSVHRRLHIQTGETGSWMDCSQMIKV